MEDLYTAQGTIKMNVVKRTANRLIAEYDWFLFYSILF
jgi:hypothetical protein